MDSTGALLVSSICRPFSFRAIRIARRFPGLKPGLKPWAVFIDNSAGIGAKEHRLEAYATLVFQTVERSLRAILVAITVSPRYRRDSVNDSIGFQPLFRLP